MKSTDVEMNCASRKSSSLSSSLGRLEEEDQTNLRVNENQTQKIIIEDVDRNPIQNILFDRILNKVQNEQNSENNQIHN